MDGLDIIREVDHCAAVTTQDLFVQVSVFVKFIGFPKTGYLDITAVCHDI